MLVEVFDIKNFVKSTFFFRSRLNADFQNVQDQETVCFPNFNKWNLIIYIVIIIHYIYFFK